MPQPPWETTTTETPPWEAEAQTPPWESGTVVASIPHNRFPAGSVSTNYGGKNTKIAPDPGSTGRFINEELIAPLGQKLDTAGNLIRGALADVGTLPVSTGEDKFRNVAAAWNNDPLPMDADAKTLPTPLRVVNAGVQGVMKTAPQMAAAMVNPALGVAAFGATPEGFDVKQAAVAAALPVIGKYSGAITEAIARKAGVSTDAALNIFNRLGGAAGAAGAIGADQLHSILQLPEDQRKDALIDAAGNVGSMFLLGGMGERTQLKDLGAVKLVGNLADKFTGRNREADDVEADLGKAEIGKQKSESSNASETLTESQRMARENVDTMAALRAQKDLTPSPENPPNSQPTPPQAEAATANLNNSPAEVPLIPVDVTERDLAASKPIADEAVPTVLDDVRGVTRGPVQFDPDHFGQVVTDARTATMPKGRPTAATRRLDSMIHTSEGTPVDEVLKGMAEQNPKYANWTPDDLATALIDAHAQESAKPDTSADARQLAEDEKRTELFQSEVQGPKSKAERDPIPAHELFVGDKFTLNGQPVEVTGHATDAETGRPSHVEVTGAYGRQTIPANAVVHLDKGSLKSPVLIKGSAVVSKSTTPQPAEAVKPDILDKAQAAIDNRLAEIKSEGRLRALGDPEVLGLHVARGAVILAKGARDFAGWSAEMVRQIGDEVKPHLQKIWDIVHDRDAENGVSMRGMNIIADLQIDQGVRDKINPVYQKLTNVDAKEQARQLGLKFPTADALADAMLRGDFKDAPGGIEVALLAHAAQRLADEQKLAEKTGNAARSDLLAQRQIDLLNHFREQSTDLAQALQKHNLLYENFSPAAWLKNFREMVGKAASRRLERAAGLPEGTVKPTALDVAQGIAAQIAKQLETTHPKLAQAIRDFYAGKAGDLTLAEWLVKNGLAEQGNAAKAAKKIESVYTKEVAKFRKKHGIPEFDQSTEREVLRRAKAIDALPRDSVQRAIETQKMFGWLQRTKGFEWWEPAREFWYGNILSGFTTIEKIFRSTALNGATEVGVQMMRHPTAIPQIISALGRAIPRSATEARRILTEGISGRVGDPFDHQTWMETRKGIASKLLLPWKLVFRSHHALHAMTYYPLEEAKALVLTREKLKAAGIPVFGGELGKLAAKKMQWLGEQRKAAEQQATDEKLPLNSPLWKSRVSQILAQKRDETLMVNAREFARLGTYSNDMYGILGAAGDQFNKFARDYPVASLVQPFVRIPINLFNGMLNWTLVGYYRAGRAQGFKLLIGKPDNTGKLFGREVTDPTAIGDEYARATIGTLATIGLLSAAGAYVKQPNPPFMVTASGPTDPNHRRLLQEAGWIPNSVKIGNRYIPYLDTPGAVGLAYIGHVMDALRYNKLDHEDAVSRAFFALSSIRNVIFDSTWAQGLTALFDTGSYRSNKNFGDKALMQGARTASGFVVPNALKQLDKIFDPTVYKADDIEAMMLTQIPFARAHGEPDLNVFGEPVQDTLLSRVESKVKGDALIQTLAGRRLWPSVPVDPDLTPGEQRDILKIRGPQLRLKLMENLPQLQTLPQKDAQKLVNQISQETTAQAKQTLGFDNLARIRKAAKP